MLNLETGYSKFYILGKFVGIPNNVIVNTHKYGKVSKNESLQNKTFL